jgi:nitroreductase
MRSRQLMSNPFYVRRRLYMEYQEVVRRRRMIRSYRSDPVPEDAVERIVSAILQGPSGGFAQGIDVIVITKPETRQSVVESLYDEPEPHSPILAAPVQLIITVDEERYHRRYNEPDKLAVTGGKEIVWPVPYWYIDAGAAMMLALLAAVDAGLAAGFYGHPDQEIRLQTILGMPSSIIPIGVLALGYSAEEPLAPEVRQRFRARRRPRSEVVHREQW